MSENTNSERTLEKVQEEYNKLCLEAGHIQYQAYAFGIHLEAINKRLKELNEEASVLRQGSKS